MYNVYTLCKLTFLGISREIQVISGFINYKKSIECLKHRNLSYI